jgi:hypothetical protein
MKQHNIDINNYREPFSSSWRQRQRRFAALHYNARSAEAAAMHAHLRASAYAQTEPTRRRVDGARRYNHAVKRTGSFANLLRAYNDQVSASFAREAVLFGVITIIALVLPIAQLVQTLPR